MHTSGTATVKALKIITATEGNYLVAKGTAIFAGGELEVEAYGRTAEELFANQNSEIVAQVKVFGGSNSPSLKIKRIMNVSAPVVEASDKRIEQVRKSLVTIKPKMTKPQIQNKVREAVAILDS